jgi:hypothetical protein
MFWILALICIILGFIVAIFEVKILFEPLVWFIAAIAFNTLGGGPAFVTERLHRG